MIPKISLFASSVREHAYEGFFASLAVQKIEHEVIFAGPNKPKGTWPGLTYIETGNIKPSQCYEIARRACKGELVQWTADDAVYKPGILLEAYNRWKLKSSKKMVFSLQTWEYGILNDMNVHHFYGRVLASPLMAPLGLMSREYLEELGGIDSRFVCGQWENDVVMRVFADGGECKILGNKDLYIFMDHEHNHGKGVGVHYDRPFALGYQHDRQILEGLWTTSHLKFREKRLDEVKKFEDKDLLTKSQDFVGIWG